MTFHEFNPGSASPPLHFAHANGFPPGAYRLSLTPLLTHRRVLALPARPLWKGADPGGLKHWAQMAEDLLGALRGSGDRPWDAVGHSMGGILTLYAAVREPGLFRRLVLLEPTMPPPAQLRKVGWMRFFGLETRPELVQGALRRRREWKSREEAASYFASRPLFRSWPPEVLEDYTRAILEEEPQGGVRLAYPPEWEARIYRTIPTDVWKTLRKLRIPTLVVRGTGSTIFTAGSESAFRRIRPEARFATLEGCGHLAPLERPLEVGDLILDFLLS